MSPSVTIPTGTPRPVITREPIFDFSMRSAASTMVDERSMVFTFDVMMSLTNNKKTFSLQSFFGFPSATR